MHTLFPLKLYTTSCCHLCDEAYALLVQLKLTDQLTVIDIANDAKLLAQYETQIPVLQRTDNFLQINWPFNKVDITKLIKT